MNTKAWPFLVSRNRSLDYRVIAAPDFLVEAQLATRLVKYVDESSSGAPIQQEARDPRIGHLTLVYRVTPAIDGERKYEDHVGRQILWIEGVVLKDSNPKLLNVDAVISAAHENVLEDYRRFWDSETDTSIKKSTAFEAEIQADIKQKTPPSWWAWHTWQNWRPRRVYLAAQPWLSTVLVIALGIMLAARVFLNRPAPDIKKLKDAAGKSYSLKELKQEAVLLIMGNPRNRSSVDE